MKQKSLYRLLKDIWQLIPASYAQYARRSRLFSLVLSRVSDWTISTAKHQEIYDSRYYDYVNQTAEASAPAMAQSIVDLFNPRNVIDIGCGTGAFLQQLRKRSIEVLGLEYSEDGLARCRAKGVSVRSWDLESNLPLAIENLNFDVTVSFEVAEHIPEPLSDRYIETLCSFSPVVVMTAATVGQGGLDHVNEQPHSYWISKMLLQGFVFQEAESLRIRSRWKEAGVASWYSNNVMIFFKEVS